MIPKTVREAVPEKYLLRYRGFAKKFNRRDISNAHLFVFPHTWDGLDELRAFLRDIPEAVSLGLDSVALMLGDGGGGAPRAETEMSLSGVR